MKVVEVLYVLTRRREKKDIANDACFLCHKPGCRSWKHTENATVNIIAMENQVDETKTSTILSAECDSDNSEN